MTYLPTPNTKGLAGREQCRNTRDSEVGFPMPTRLARTRHANRVSKTRYTVRFVDKGSSCKHSSQNAKKVGRKASPHALARTELVAREFWTRRQPASNLRPARSWRITQAAPRSCLLPNSPMQASTTDEDAPPKVHVRWFQVEVPDLLTIAPLVLNSTISWRPLTREESDACETAWLALPPPSKSRPMSRAESSRSQGSAAAVDAEPLPPSA